MNLQEHLASLKALEASHKQEIARLEAETASLAEQGSKSSRALNQHQSSLEHIEASIRAIEFMIRNP